MFGLSPLARGTLAIEAAFIRWGGLSPLARGTQFLNFCQRCWRRFIPADAGNTILQKRATSCGSVYPRWRGEHPFYIPSPEISTGLSPLARGTLRLYACLRIYHRFIPAGAGNTSASYGMKVFPPVYPRWRGEHIDISHQLGRIDGLSPLARGTPRFEKSLCCLWRFIPAGAGNTLKLYICSKSPFLLPNKLPTVR
ncbi:Domain of uncharacterised function (DUF2825) [Salmonella enterica subsp. indica]|uniref:Domain of uncharacterized function (DUF2825) n=1 Tax=Salmonella enterica subsp. indica TaxID=59207 RepID=A0A379XM71_SALER|nr:Domain of uncharacterised function (DUF2825) [Salmonella enterica subsp. indica]